MPRGTHDLSRVAAGGLWVVIAGGVVAAVDLASGWYLLDEGIHSWWHRWYLPPDGATAPALYVLGLLTMYALASVPAVALAKPARWVFGVIIVYVALFAIVRMAPTMGSRWLTPVFAQHGFVSATMGSAAAGGGIHTEIVTMMPDPPAPGAQQVEREFTIGGEPARTLVAASLLWMTPAVAALLLISAARRER